MKTMRKQASSCLCVWLLLFFSCNAAVKAASLSTTTPTTTTKEATDNDESECRGYNAALEREIDEQMDVNVAPCNDFYEYACGNWRVAYRLRRLGARDTRTLVRALNKQLLMQHLEASTTTTSASSSSTSSSSSSSTSSSSSAIEKRVVDFYNSCLSMQLSGASRDTIRIYTDVLRQFSVWPLLDASYDERNATTFDWQNVSAQLRRYGAQTFWRLLVQTNWQAADQLIFYMMPPSFDFIKSANDDAYMYQRYIKYLLLDLGVRVRKANTIAEELVSFERELLELTTVNDHSLVLREPQTLAALARELPQLQVLSYFETLLADLPERPTDFAERLLVVADIKYLEKLLALLQRTKVETIAKYMLVQFLAHFELQLHEDKTSNEQREYCLQQLNDFMPDELTRLYLRLLQQELAASTTTTTSKIREVDTTPTEFEFMRDAHSQLNQHFEHVKLQFERALNETTVFETDAETRALGLQKLRAMRLLLPTLELEAKADERQRSLTLPAPAPMSDNYDVNLLQLSKSRTLAEFRQVALRMNEGQRQRDYGPLDVNAYYRLKKNAIELPVGILRPPFWHRCLPTARLYGSLVYVLSHELLHGFDYDGLNYDKSGNIANNWSVKSIIRYGTRSSCYLLPRYSNATLNLNENIADSEGLRVAFEAYKSQTQTPMIANNDLKSFFIGFAQTWCGHAAPTTTTVTQHASNRERVNNVLGNFPEFAEVFQCQASNLMHTNDRCRIW